MCDTVRLYKEELQQGFSSFGRFDDYTRGNECKIYAVLYDSEMMVCFEKMTILVELKWFLSSHVLNKIVASSQFIEGNCFMITSIDLANGNSILFFDFCIDRFSFAVRIQIQTFLRPI